MSDLISRSTLMQKVVDGWLKGEDFDTHITFVYEADIMNATAVEAELVQHGKWEVNTKTGKYRCSVCKTDEIVTPWGKPPFARCPTCGAKMDEVKE